MAKSNAERMRRQDIFDLQNMLYIVSRHKNGSPDILPDGIMNDKTTKAVMSFQEQNGLDVTGIADFETRDCLRNVYEDVLLQKSRAHHIHFFDKGEAPNLKKGDNSDSVYMLQLIFRILANEFATFLQNEITGLFDDITEMNVKEFQRINEFEQHGIVDRQTWDRLAMYYNFYS